MILRRAIFNTWAIVCKGLSLKSRLFWAQMALAALVAISGPKKVLISGTTPYNGPRNEYCPPQNHYVPRHKNNRYINSYYDTLLIWPCSVSIINIHIGHA